ncbi:MAG: hypothetical protein OCC49_11830 [Fibrobacterales bacterium]
MKTITCLLFCLSYPPLFAANNFSEETLLYCDATLPSNTECIQIDPGDLFISELYPAPTGDQPEWYELSNRSEHSISLTTLTLRTPSHKGGKPYSLVEPNSKKKLKPMEQCVFTQDSITFKEVYGTLRLCIIQPPKWYTLSNSGGAFLITTSPALITDSVTWSASQVTSGTALTRLSPFSDQWNSSPSFETGTPGALVPIDTLSNSFSLSDRNCIGDTPETCINGTLTLKVNETFRWQVFDFSGYRVMQELISESGTTQLHWNGSRTNGQMSHPGLYILTSQFNNEPLSKTPIVIQP